MLSFFYNYWYSNSTAELQTITKQRRLRHELHRQIVFSKLKLKPTITVYKSGFHEIDRMNSQKAYLIPIPNEKNKKRKLK
jgi:hypothetical protein